MKTKQPTPAQPVDLTRIVRRCAWCGKQRRKFSGFEQQDLSNEWLELCCSCKGRRDALMVSGNPFAGIIVVRRKTPNNAISETCKNEPQENQTT